MSSDTSSSRAHDVNALPIASIRQRQSSRSSDPSGPAAPPLRAIPSTAAVDRAPRGARAYSSIDQLRARIVGSWIVATVRPGTCRCTGAVSDSTSIRCAARPTGAISVTPRRGSSSRPSHGCAPGTGPDSGRGVPGKLLCSPYPSVRGRVASSSGAGDREEQGRKPDSGGQRRREAGRHEHDALTEP